MKSGWTRKNLGDLCQVIGGGTPSKDKAKYYSGDIPWATVRDMRSEVITETECKITREAVKCSATNIIPSGNVVIATRVGLGKVCLLGQDTAINQDLRGIVPIDPKVLSVRFLFWWLKSIADSIVAEGTGATVQGVKLPFVKSLQAPVPPLNEQQRIVSILDEAFDGIATAIANAEKNLHNARALFESHLQSVFTRCGKGWEERPFSELCDIKHGYAFEGEFFSNEGEYVLLTPGNFYETGGYRDRGEKQKYYTGEIPRDYVLNKGDLLVAMTEQAAGLLGSPILVPESKKFLHNQRLGLVTKKPGAAWTNEFFFHVFNTQPARKAIHASASGVKVRHTSPTKIGEVVVGFPVSLTEQKRVVSTLAALTAETQRLESIYQQKLTAFDELKKSLLHQAFTGQLTADSIDVSAPAPIRFPTELKGISTTDLHAGILALSHQFHEKAGKLEHFGHVKAEKIAHMIEARLGIDLGRKPMKDAAGPNDFPHLHKVEHRARKANFFDFKRVEGAAYRVHKLRSFDRLIERTRAALGGRANVVDGLLELMLPMQTQQAEIFCTVYAAWNNLLLGGKRPTDEEIVFEARENWHPDKLKIPREKFISAIEWIRNKALAPPGKGKKVCSRVE